MINLKCSGCGKTLRAKDEQAGKASHCPSCKAAITIPVEDSAEKEITDAAAPSAPVKKGGTPMWLFAMFLIVCPIGFVLGILGAVGASGRHRAVLVVWALVSAVELVCVFAAEKWKRWGVYGLFGITLSWVFLYSGYSIRRAMDNPQESTGELLLLYVGSLSVLSAFYKYVRPKWKWYS